MTDLSKYVLKVTATPEGGEQREGSAFLVSPERAITAAHVIDGGGRIELRHESTILEAVHAPHLSDLKQDIAVLELRTSAPETIPIATIEPLIANAATFAPRCGQAVVGVGYPTDLLDAREFRGRIVSRAPVAHVDLGSGHLNVFLVEPDRDGDGFEVFIRGCSGGPIFDPRTNTIVGMVAGFQAGFANQPFCYGVPLGTLPNDAILPREAQRAEVVWRLAYTFLRLDQIPTAGGWGRTLYRWMDNLWAGDEGMTPRNSSLRRKGGTDLTCYALFTLVDFLERAGNSTSAILKPIAHKVYQNFAENVAPDGGLGLQERRTDAAYRIRHTALGALVFAQCSQINPGQGRTELRQTMDYLRENIAHWEKDTSHPLAMVAALKQLASLPDPDPALVPARDGIRQELRRMQEDLLDDSRVKVQPRPPGTREPYHSFPFFRPYGGFWRMERSNFLMSLAMLLRSNELEPDLRNRCAEAIDILLGEIEQFDSTVPEKSLVPYYHQPTDADPHSKPPRDWGLSAELAVLLTDGTLRQWLAAHGVLPEALDKKTKDLRRGLLATVDKHLEKGHLFQFTHGSSFGRAMLLFGPRPPQSDALGELDRAISDLIRKGVTESGLDRLLKEHVLAPAGSAHGISVDSVRRMLVEKLEAGEFLSKQTAALLPDRTSEINGRTIAFYDDAVHGKRYAEHYGEAPIRSLVTRLRNDPAICPTGGFVNALDVGCGPGQYAKLLQQERFEVELLDASARMLEEAGRRLGLAPASLPPPRDVFELRKYYRPDTFDLVFACALMVHVPRSLARSVLRSFHEVLRPGGVLFVNFKIGDHSLIAHDGRYFEYYASEQAAADLLSAAGFEIQEQVVRWNRLNSYKERCEIRWANFYCHRPQ